jgi:hypothetical protein
MRKVFSSDSQSFSHFGEGRIFDLPALPRREKNRGSPKLIFSTVSQQEKFSHRIPRLSATFVKVGFSTSQLTSAVGEGQNRALQKTARVRIVRSHILPGVNNWLTSCTTGRRRKPPPTERIGRGPGETRPHGASELRAPPASQRDE